MSTLNRPVETVLEGRCTHTHSHQHRYLEREPSLELVPGNVEFRGAWWLCSSRIGNYDSVRIDIAIPGTLSLLEGRPPRGP